MRVGGWGRRCRTISGRRFLRWVEYKRGACKPLARREFRPGTYECEAGEPMTELARNPRTAVGQRRTTPSIRVHRKTAAQIAHESSAAPNVSRSARLFCTSPCCPLSGGPQSWRWLLLSAECHHWGCRPNTERDNLPQITLFRKSLSRSRSCH